jgi:DNA invertase Pin-like site-specific DNA recombinase
MRRVYETRLPIKVYETALGDKFRKLLRMKIGYARVSTRDQDLELQLDALTQAGCALIYQEKASGALAARVELDKLLLQVGPGDTVYIYKLDRLGLRWSR